MFWPAFFGDDPVNDSFFIHLLSKVFQTEVSTTHDMSQADILIESSFCGTHSVVYDRAWKYTFFFTGECHYGNITPLLNYSCVLGYNKTEGNFVALPLFIPYIYCNPHLLTPVQQYPEHMVGAVICNPNGFVRNRFLDSLEQKAHVLYGGSYRNNIGGNVEGYYASDALTQFYSKCRFAITMENSVGDYYLTEKIINGFRAGVISIYFGSPCVGTYVHEDRFLCLKHGSDEEIDSTIDTMLTMSEEEYMRRVNGPIFKVPLEDMIDTIVQEIRVCLRL